MTPEFLSRAVEDIPSLRAVFVTAMPDCLLFDSWLRSDSDWKAEEVASYFGDLFRANRESLKSLGSWSADILCPRSFRDAMLCLPGAVVQLRAQPAPAGFAAGPGRPPGRGRVGHGAHGRALNEHLPDFMVVDFHDQMVLRMLALVESLRLRIPVLALRKSTVEGRPLPVPREIVENEGASEPEAETFDELVELGFAKALARNYRDAAEAFERALELRPEDTRVKFNLGKVRRRLEE